MTRYLAKRAVEIVVTLALMSLVVYLLIGLMPGDPIDLMIAGDPRMTSADAARLRALYELDKPLLERYRAWAARRCRETSATRAPSPSRCWPCWDRACSTRCSVRAMCR